MADEAAKLQSHLKLLREEYVKLQKNHAELERKYQVVAAANGENDEENFVSRLMKIIADLFDKDLYSDMKIKLKESELHGHKFVLAARSEQWSMTELANVSVLDLSDIDRDVGYEMVKWIYTGCIDIGSNDVFLLDLLKVATRFSLLPLGEACEKALMSSVNMKNCIRYYQTAEEIGAEVLKKHCSELISSHWNDFTSDDFASMPAPLAYKMFKSKSEYPLHTAIKAHREDVVFLYLMEYNALLPGKLNEMNGKGELSLDLALVEKQESIARTLVEHKVDMNGTDQQGSCLLHKAIKRGDNFSGKFLIENKADVNLATNYEKQTPLHLVANKGSDMAPTASLLLQHKADVNAQDLNGCTPMHLAIQQANEEVFKVLLEDSLLKTELQNSEGESVLWLALQSLPPGENIANNTFASRLVKRGCSPDAVNPETGDSLLHMAARAGLEIAALFLTDHGAKINVSNKKGETPLHTACKAGLVKLAQVLLEKGGNPNAQTTAPIDEGDEQVYKLTPLHIGINHKHKGIVQVYLDYKDKVTKGGNNLQIIPNFALKDSQDQTVLALALWTGFHDTASQLLAGGANINDYNSEGQTMLHQAIMRQDSKSALFLLERQADPNCRTQDGESSLQLAIKRHLPVVVDALCKRGANMNIWDEAGDCALWQALESGQEDVASILVRHGCDTDMWHKGPGDCQQTLLHRAIDESNESVACFLIRSMCDINSPRQAGPNGEGGEEARDGQTPLHLASAWALEKIIQSLVEQNADVNAQDAEGKTALHITIENQHMVIISLLMAHPLLNLTLKDKLGRTPFATAMMTRNNKAAQMILDREPTAAEQFDNKGRNFLHLAVQSSDIESVLFLISVRANVNSKVNDASKKTPLHIAAAAGSEMIVRNLILAGANVNELTPQKQTALHFAASHDHATICQILIDNHIDYDFVDENLNNALHIAVQLAHLSSVRVLLTESRINAEAVNARGQNPVHILGQYGKENAAAIFELFMECMPEYPINKPDDNGNTVLLLAYMNGNGNLCRAIVRTGAQLGNANKEGLSIFNAPVATKQLLFKLLDMLSKEPPWCEGETCLECGAKFGIKTRKHHCRHCGRLLCSKCSDKDMPIIKYNITKPTRVCEICFDVMTLGTGLS